MSDTAAALPDLDAYAHLSNAEIAASVAAWPDDSEDQRQALVALAGRAPGIGHNRPPLAEALDAETAALRRRAAEIVELAGKAVIVDDDSAKKVTDLAVKCADIEDEIKTARLARSKPFRDAVDLINNIYGDIARPVALARGGDTGRAGLRGMITVWDDRQRAAAVAEQARRREEQRRLEAEAAEAQRKVDEAAAAGRGQVNAEIEAAQVRERADQAQVRADAVRAVPIRSHLGQVSRRREINFAVTDLPATCTWLISQEGHRNNIEQAVRTIIGAHLRAIGIDAVARGVNIPGITASVGNAPAAVRR